MTRAGDVGLPTRTMRFSDRNNWAPRLGMAYRPSFLKNTVIRSGYGIFYIDALNGNNLSDFTATSVPWIITQSVNNTDPPTLTNQHLFEPLDTPGAAIAQSAADRLRPPRAIPLRAGMERLGAAPIAAEA